MTFFEMQDDSEEVVRQVIERNGESRPKFFDDSSGTANRIKLGSLDIQFNEVNPVDLAGFHAIIQRPQRGALAAYGKARIVSRRLACARGKVVVRQAERHDRDIRAGELPSIVAQYFDMDIERIECEDLSFGPDRVGKNASRVADPSAAVHDIIARRGRDRYSVTLIEVLPAEQIILEAMAVDDVSFPIEDEVVMRGPAEHAFDGEGTICPPRLFDLPVGG